MTSDLEIFLQVLAHGPLLHADAIVVLCGEDAGPRVEMGVKLFKAGAAPRLVLSGGKDRPPRWLGADSCARTVLARGLAPSAFYVEDQSQDTHEQAVAVVGTAIAEGWTRLLLVASAYHLARATLTFVQALTDAGVADTIRLIPIPTEGAWGEAPAGMIESRVQLASRECGKIERYLSHVARPAEGTVYFLRWEGR